MENIFKKLFLYFGFPIATAVFGYFFLINNPANAENDLILKGKASYKVIQPNKEMEALGHFLAEKSGLKSGNFTQEELMSILNGMESALKNQETPEEVEKYIPQAPQLFEKRVFSNQSKGKDSLSIPEPSLSSEEDILDYLEKTPSQK